MWIAIAERVTTRPIRIIILTLLAILPFLIMTNFTKTSFDQIKDLPSSNGSVIGYQIMSKGFPQGELMPTKIVIKSDENFWKSENLKVLDQLCDNLTKIETVDLVRTASRPSGEKLTEATLTSQMNEMSKGVTKIDDGIKPLYDGLIKIQKNTEKIAKGLKSSNDGFIEMSNALALSADGLKKTSDALNKLEDGTKSSANGLNQTQTGLDQLSKAVSDAKTGIEQSIAALGNAELAMKALLKEKPELASNVNFQGALQTVSGVKANLPQITGGLDQINDGIKKSSTAIGSVSSGLSEIGTGMKSSSKGIVTIKDGVNKISLAQLDAGKELKTAGEGLSKLSDGVGKSADGVDKLGDGISKLDSGIKDNYKGSTALNDVFYLPDTAIKDSKELRDAMGQYISSDGKGVYLDVILKVAPYSAAALDTMDKINEITEFSLIGTSLEKAEFHVGGMSAAMNEVRALIAGDFVIVMIFVLSGIFIVLCIMLRSLIAPIYLIFTILISYGCTMGISVLVFQYIGGGDGLHWAVPFFSFCVLVALGVDYNIFLMSRVKEEYRPGETRKGVAVALASTGGLITSCGIIMAGTFGAMLFSPVRFTAVIGLLIDTFVIRTLLVPAIAVKFGELNWWPGRKVKVVPGE